MKHRYIVSADLPTPEGPYSPGIVFGNLVFVSGQVGTHPKTGKLAGLGVEDQTEQALDNIAKILEAAGSSLRHVLRCGVFLTDMDEFPKMNSIYERVFNGHKPARSTVQAYLGDESYRIEVDAIAYIP